MPALTNPGNIPVAIRPKLKEIIFELGPMLLAEEWPEGITQASDITNQQLALLFEKCTRKLWAERMKDVEIRTAVRQKNSEYELDPFGAQDATPSF